MCIVNLSDHLHNVLFILFTYKTHYFDSEGDYRNLSLELLLAMHLSRPRPRVGKETSSRSQLPGLDEYERIVTRCTYRRNPQGNDPRQKRRYAQGTAAFRTFQ